MSEVRFNVVQFFVDDSYEYVRRAVPAKRRSRPQNIIA